METVLDINSMDINNLMALQLQIKAKLQKAEKEIKEHSWLTMRETERLLFNAIEKLPIKNNIDINVAGVRVKLTFPKNMESLSSGISTSKNVTTSEIKVKKEKTEKTPKEKFQTILDFFKGIVESNPSIPCKGFNSIMEHKSTQTATIWLSKHFPLELKDYNDKKQAFKATQG